MPIGMTRLRCNGTAKRVQRYDMVDKEPVGQSNRLAHAMITDKGRIIFNDEQSQSIMP
jgi:hypothetical protein